MKVMVAKNIHPLWMHLCAFDAKDRKVFLMEPNENYAARADSRAGQSYRVSLQSFIDWHILIGGTASRYMPLTSVMLVECFSVLLRMCHVAHQLNGCTHFDLGLSTSISVYSSSRKNIVTSKTLYADSIICVCS